MAVIKGNTFAVKDKLKALGGVWRPALKGWVVPDSVASQAQALVEAAPVSRHPVGSRRPSGGRQRTCKDCGQKINYGVYCGKCEFGR